MKTHDINFATRPKILAIDILSYNSIGMAFAPYRNYWRQRKDPINLTQINEHKEAQLIAKDDQSEPEDLVDVLVQYEDGSK
ncbi:unnamed protein product [Sphenostylis stenocarpa]|uniref:Uncharacterized protein n=1 Tax=Sphenostylis stenocarpa TaxID=92480 RepID=A0AA86VPM6_9FABA|nr:unnamed protein product [Sphenostylis stenocarpa]